MPRRQIAAVRMMDAADPASPPMWLAAPAQLPVAPPEWTPACPAPGPVATLMASRPQLRHDPDRLRRPEVAWAVRVWRAWPLPAAGSPRVDPLPRHMCPGTLRQVLAYARGVWRVLHHFIAGRLVLRARAGVARLAGLIELRGARLGTLDLLRAIARLAVQVPELRPVRLRRADRALRRARAYVGRAPCRTGSSSCYRRC